MIVETTEVPGVLAIEPRVFGDERGVFLETFNTRRYAEHGIAGPFVQDNVSRSEPGVLRGLHLQHPHGQGKLVSVVEGAVLDVAVDVRVGSPFFGQHVARRLDAARRNQLWIPSGFAHGFCVLGDTPATFVYKCTDFYAPDAEMTIRFDDPTLGIRWPVAEPLVSGKDRAGALLSALERSRLPRWEAS